ncbi:hypothetical protein [Microvirga massiliensis]|uniref:hypothetical protein n=1 Tax=Microvirga massiliensis TaxID=1033741 RepID=UPI00062B3239|nr:hypothetical protein [Microvirga massiliensis]
MPFVARFDAFSRASPPRAVRPPRRNLILRIVDAIAESNRRKAEQEVAGYIARNGSRFTDRLEVEIAQRFGSNR